jgi:Spy/CpxP family protein refolding chaperone
MKTTFSPRLIVTTLAMSLGLAASAFAMPPRGEMPYGPHAGIHESRVMHGMKEMSRLHDDLKLDAKQDALWKDAETASKNSKDSLRERFRKQHEETLSMLNQPGADLRAVLKRMDELRSEGQKLRDANRDRWLAVYDSLNVEQKEKTRIFFKNKLERMDRAGSREPGQGRTRR